MQSLRHHGELSLENSGVSLPVAPALRVLEGGVRDGNAEVLELARLARLASAEAPDRTESLAVLWQALVVGRERAVLSYSEGGSCFVVVRAAQAGERLPSLANARNLALLTRVLLGEPQKIVALDFEVSASSVAAIAAQYSEAMGFQGGVRRVPILLIMAAHAAARGQAELVARCNPFEHDGVPHRVLAVTPPNPARWTSLSAAECAVVALLLERHPNAAIARLRQTSARTVANQVGSVMHKLGARGRSEIISRMIEGVGS